MATFPDDFVFGVSTASYQIEGAWSEDDKGLSIWDTFSHTPGNVAAGDTGDVACDHYHRFKEDVALMQELGSQAYRFSTSWPRIFPLGTGKPNRKGLDFYERLTDSLLEANITPWLCFYHWDLPQALQDRGGWTNRDIAHWFGDYAQFVAEQLGDRVRHFIMLNEPNAVAFMGHFLGQHAPGHSDLVAFTAAIHHLNLAQGAALRALREGRAEWQLGTILNLQPVHPAGDSEEDLQAAKVFDAVSNRNHLDPLFFGRYPEETALMLEPHVREGDLNIIKQRVDFLGLNLYTRFLVQADPTSLVGMRLADPPPQAKVTDMGWEIYPRALYEQIMDLERNYGNPPLYITENGAAFADEPDSKGDVHDEARIHFLERYLRAAHRALEAGADLKGYFVWSLLDNFEWAEGYSKRFGLVHVDYATQKRTPKASFHWYKKLIATHRLEEQTGS